eukprot:6189108-Pleurochrysis_carterae.AAC.1
MDLTSAKRHSVDDASHRALIDSSESEKLGTIRTSRSVTGTVIPLSSKADSGMSPIAVQRWGRPSIPATRSEQGRTFTKSETCGRMCQVHPLSMTKPILRAPSRKARP